MKSRFALLAVLAFFALTCVASAHYHLPLSYAKINATDFARRVCSDARNCTAYAADCQRKSRARILCAMALEHEEATGERYECKTFLQYKVGASGRAKLQKGEPECFAL